MKSWPISSSSLPACYPLLHNGVVMAQGLLAMASPLVPLAGGHPILDRAMDLIFALYLALIGLRCLLDKPSFRLITGLVLVAVYGSIGFTEAVLNDNVNGFVFEAKLLVSIALFFCLLDKRPEVSDFSVRFLFASFLLGCFLFLALNPEKRLHIINESNYVCLYLGIAMFSYLSWKGKKIGIHHVGMLLVFTLFIIVTSQSRTGLGFLAVAWLVYIKERFGWRSALNFSVFLAVAGSAVAAAALALQLPIVDRFAELKDPKKVDRFIYLHEANKIMQRRPLHENLVRFSFANPVSTRVNEKMKWLTEKGKHGTESGQLYPHHFHLAYLRILVGHGAIAFLAYLAAIALVWPVNKYLSLGLAVCSLSMSVPYLSLFFGALHLAMAFPSKRRSLSRSATSPAPLEAPHSSRLALH